MMRLMKISRNKIYLLIILLSIIIIGCEKATSLIFQVDSTSCNACGECVQVCPYDAIEIIDNKAVIDQTKCTQCGECIDACPKGAIH